jgi:DNA-directed RNA polymerase subunit omega
MFQAQTETHGHLKSHLVSTLNRKQIETYLAPKDMNSTLVKQALEIVLNPNVLVNLVSQRVRQLNSGGGGMSRPLVANVENLGAADIALREIIENKMDFTVPESLKLTRPTGRNRRRPQHWTKS